MTKRDQTQNGATLTFRLGNADFAVTREAWPVDKLKLDPANPRLGYLLRQNKKGAPVTDKELAEMLWDIDQVKALYQSVFQNGGLLEDPVIRRDGTVVEGNCRTVVLRQLRSKYPEDERFEKVFVRILPKDVTDEQISLLLGELHIAGKIEWRAFDQAEYVWKMNKIFGKTYDFLATHLRWSRSKLAQKIAAYEETKAYLDRFGDPQGINKFSHFEELMKKKPLRDLRDQNPDFMRKFGQWVLEGRLPGGTDVRDLPGILDNEEALRVFESKGIRDAKLVLQKANPALGSNLYSALDQASAELESIALNEITELKTGDDARLQKLRRLASAIKRVETFAEIDLSEA